MQINWLFIIVCLPSILPLAFLDVGFKQSPSVSFGWTRSEQRKQKISHVRKDHRTIKANVSPTTTSSFHLTEPRHIISYKNINCLCVSLISLIEPESITVIQLDEIKLTLCLAVLYIQASLSL